MNSSPGPATLWGILESENSPVSAPPVEDVDIGVFAIPRLPPPMLLPVVQLFGENYMTLRTPRSGLYLHQLMFYRYANADDLIRLNYGLFHNDYPDLTGVVDPARLRREGVAAQESAQYDVEIVVLIADGVPILLHVEMIRSLRYLYWMFVDPREHVRYAYVGVPESANVWKIALLAVYGTDYIDLDDHPYTGEEYIAAIALVQKWAGQKYIIRSIIQYFKSYCVRFETSLRNLPIPAPRDQAGFNAHDYALAEIQVWYVHYRAIRGRYRTLPMGTFGEFAVSAIHTPYLIARLHQLVEGFRFEINMALPIQDRIETSNHWSQQGYPYPEAPPLILAPGGGHRFY
ncbi:hypothetical protein GL218_05165 [Daldinia childiae]|uniref:uncharacterized protein n=1 Tax=Daldinia childiae TaxID=326645 RepID=UPI0014460E80|nr:uncharacterized protein GL218_05165 [Daldinia childiae]KAF3059487.1 hypothetical protein GL218_05165 [Daldinia childiae]